MLTQGLEACWEKAGRRQGRSSVAVGSRSRKNWEKGKQSEKEGRHVWLGQGHAWRPPNAQPYAVEKCWEGVPCGKPAQRHVYMSLSCLQPNKKEGNENTGIMHTRTMEPVFHQLLLYGEEKVLEGKGEGGSRRGIGREGGWWW